MKKIILFFAIVITAIILSVLFNIGRVKIFLYEEYLFKNRLPLLSSKEVIYNCRCSLKINNKVWLHKNNSIEKVNKNINTFSGFELDLLWDTTSKTLLINHPPDKITGLTLPVYLEYFKNKPDLFFWFDIKNLSNTTEKNIFNAINSLDSIYKLKNRVIIESVSPSNLQSFNKAGFYTSFYLDGFNVFRMNKDSILPLADSLQNLYKRYPTCAVSSDYVNIPFMKRYFANTNILTWHLLNYIGWKEHWRQLKIENDAQIKVVLVKFSY